MKKRTDPRIDAYIQRSAPFAQPVLRHLRKLVHEACPEAEETIKWGMPSFLHAGKILCGMAAFKGHCTFGFWHRQMRREVANLAGQRGDAMGSFGRITGLSDLPPARTMLGYLRKAAKLNASEEPARSRTARKPARSLRVPDDLAAALSRKPSAAATFKGFSPSHRNEYVEWITEAKRDETRAKRLETAVGWIAEGKPRNWKYEKC